MIPAALSVITGDAVLAHSRLLITGRYHPSILASPGGTPHLFLASDSHKTLSLQHIIEYSDACEYPTFPTQFQIPGMMERASNMLDQGDVLLSVIRATANQCARDAVDQIDFIERASEHG